MYDLNEIKKRVKHNRIMLITEFSAILALMIAALIPIILKLNTTVTFVFILVEVILIFLVYVIFDKQSPMVCFSREIKGVNVMEDDYVVKNPKPGLKWRQVGGPASPAPITPNTGANRRRTPPNIRCRVYLKQENGNIVTVSSLYKSHIELFSEGDVLLKYAGTQFPVIVSGNINKQPCPICGEVNDMSENNCKICGLKITRQ